MTCVWDGLVFGLKTLDYNMNIHELVDFIKHNNKETSHVTINDRYLTKQEIIENMEHIKLISNINDGYLCSTSDPLFCLVAELFNINIIHEYNSIIKGNNNKAIINYVTCSNKTLYVSSNTNHFSFNKCEFK